jgi:hypothetical protein
VLLRFVWYIYIIRLLCLTLTSTLPFRYCTHFSPPTLIITMPKIPTALYNHATRNATARQLNISGTVSGRSSYSYTSSQVTLEPVAPESHPAHEDYVNDLDVDINIDDGPGDLNTADEDGIVEVVPGVQAIITPPKAKRYENSVSQFLSLSEFLA